MSPNDCKIKLLKIKKKTNYMYDRIGNYLIAKNTEVLKKPVLRTHARESGLRLVFSRVLGVH